METEIGVGFVGVFGFRSGYGFGVGGGFRFEVEPELEFSYGLVLSFKVVFRVGCVCELELEPGFEAVPEAGFEFEFELAMAGAATSVD